MTSLLFHFWFYLALIVALVFMSVTFFVGFFFVAKGEPLSRFAVGGVESRHAAKRPVSPLSRITGSRISDRPDRILSSKNLCANQCFRAHDDGKSCWASIEVSDEVELLLTKLRELTK